MSRLVGGDADARRAVSMARETGHPMVELLAPGALGLAAPYAGNHPSALQRARQAEQAQTSIPGPAARMSSFFWTMVLTEARDLAAAERVRAAGLARSRDVGDLDNLGHLLFLMAMLELRAGRASDAAAHLREGLQIAVQAGIAELIRGLDCCGHLCAGTGRPADAVTVWSAMAALTRHGQVVDWPTDARRRDHPLPPRPRGGAAMLGGPSGSEAARVGSRSQRAAVAQERPTGRKVEADRRQRCDRPGRS